MRWLYLGLATPTARVYGRVIPFNNEGKMRTFVNKTGMPAFN